MPEQHSFFCRGIPALWWWLGLLLGLPLLALAMLYYSQPRIEADLHQRVASLLSDKELDWAEARFSGRGRDLWLGGVAATEVERDQARALAAGVEGVRVVENAIRVEPFAEPALSLEHSGTGVILRGLVPSAEKAQALMNAARRTFGEAVEDRLEVGGRVATPEWLTGAENIFAGLGGLRQPVLELGSGHLRLEGEVDGETDRQRLLQQVAGLPGVQAEAAIRVVPPALPPKPASLAVALTDGGLRLEGVLGSEAESAALVAAAGERVGAGQVDNRLQQLAGTPPAGWLQAAALLIRQLPEQGGALRVKADVLALEGVMDDSAARNRLLEAGMQALEGSKVSLLDKTRLTTGAAPEPAPAAEPAAPAGKSDPQAAGCQQQLDAQMSGQTILFASNQAIIRTESAALLKKLADVLLACQDVITARGVRIEGHTDATGDDAYNLRLSQLRADAVRNYLERAGVAAAVMEAVGYGESRPVAGNDTAAGRARNRRIVFEIR
ncbi:MAG TPA: OmpA family protein [Thiolinea sp.]|nr:OmpA family protein [Thiolinea sp.]